MSKMKELATVLDELITIGTELVDSAKRYSSTGEKLIKVAKSLRDIFSEEDTAPAPKEIPAVKAYTKEDVRATLAKASAGHKEEVKALLTKYGADTLTKLDPAHYAAIVADAESLAHE